MLDSQSAAFAERVWDVASQLGNNAPKIADDIMEAAFPLMAVDGGTPMATGPPGTP